MNVETVSVDNPLTATSYMRATRYSDSCANHNVADAFTERRYLVKLMYAQQTFVVAVTNVEARDKAEALEVALSRASQATIQKRQLDAPQRLRVGNLTSSLVVQDTPELREQLGVHGPKELLTYENLRAA